MPNMTLAIPADLKQKMDRFKEINWSEVARQAVREQILTLERMNQLLSKSKFNAKDIVVHASSIKKSVFQKHRRG